MPVSSLSELVEALTRQEWDRVVGTPESSWVDFKTAPYALAEDRGKVTLAADVAAFANAAGGALVVGYEAQKAAHSAQELAVRHRPVNKSVVDGDAIQSVIADRIFPRVRGVRLGWYPPEPATEGGVLLIEVPPQDEGARPFVVERVLEGDRSSGRHAIAVPIREGDRNDWLRAEELQRLLNEARNRVGLPSAYELKTMDRLQQFTRCREVESTIVRVMKWQDQPRLFIQAVPPPKGPSPLRGFWEPSGVLGALSAPASLRLHGFNLYARERPGPFEGALTYFRDERRAIWLEPDGAFTLGATARADYLGWYINNEGRSDGRLRLNPLVLAELTLEFFRFVESVLVPLAPPLKDWSVRASVSNWARPTRVYVVPGPPDAIEWPHSGDVQPPNAAEMQPFDLDVAGRSAFAVLRWLYGLHGLPEGAIPYAGDGAIQSDALRAQSR